MSTLKKMMIVQKGLWFESGYKLINKKERSKEKLRFNYKGIEVWKSCF
jgi:hypothetical protein